jgi:hypothetical protein
MGERKGSYRVLVGQPERKRPLEIHRRRWGIILKLNFRTWDMGAWTGLIWLRTGTDGGHL